jgi:hypothetical protein
MIYAEEIVFVPLPHRIRGMEPAVLRRVLYQAWLSSIANRDIGPP